MNIPEIKNPDQLVTLIDFDWTLHDTTAFCVALWDMIASEAGLAVTTVEDEGEHLFHVDQRLGGYDFNGHVASYDLEEVTMWSKLHELINDTDFLYPDAPAFIQELKGAGFYPSILSFGEEVFQRAKISPTIGRLVGADDTNALECTVVFEPKTDYIARTYPGERGVLVDDKDKQNLPLNFTELHYNDKSGLENPLETPTGFMVATLAQAAEVIKNL